MSRFPDEAFGKAYGDQLAAFIRQEKAQADLGQDGRQDNGHDQKRYIFQHRLNYMP